MTKHKNVALDELRILAALMVLGGVEGRFADVGRRPAVELLAGAGIAV